MIEIKNFEKQHTEGVIKLIIDIQQLEFQVPITIEDQPDLYVIEEFYQKEGGNFWVALSQGEVVGSIALIDCGKNIGCIRKMFVKKEYRGKELGVAQNLLNRLTAWAKDRGFEQVYLGTIERLQAAIAFYKRNGFTQIEKKKLPEVFPIMAVDTHFFEKKINNEVIEIINYEPQYQQAFKEINVEWIEVNFVVEQHDFEQLDAPENILNKGGQIFLAKLCNEIVGTAILAYEGNGVYELGKMAVRPKAKGLGIGKMLCQHTIDIVKANKATKFYLESNRLQEVAIIMYLKLGFYEVPLNANSHYARVDIKMEYPL